jgi:hypothetical protein
MVKVFTMVKGENDIVKDWVMYHGNLFGYKNLYIIDNFSRDGTYETLVSLKNQYGINLFRSKDYKKKGDYMTFLIKKFCKNEYAFPIDIDEFIVLYDKPKNVILCDNESIYNYIKTLPLSNAYKMNYIFSKNLVSSGYERATIDSEIGTYIDYGSNAKTFFHSLLFKNKIDHGNHFNTNNYYLTNFCLIHYHIRNLDQMKKKVYNNILGLGYTPFNLPNLKHIIQVNPTIEGSHHINNQIKILENNFNIPIDTILPNDVSLKPISNKLLSIYNL